MNTPPLSTVDLVQTARFRSDDLVRINACREPHTRLGFGYQLAFVRLYNRLPSQQPLEIIDEILNYVGIQLDIETAVIQQYQKQRRTIINHQQEIRHYLNITTRDHSSCSR